MVNVPVTKDEYLRKLGQLLENDRGRLSASEIDEILAETRAHFDEGLRHGKTEPMIGEALGDPRMVAEGYLAQALVRPPTEARSLSVRSTIFLRVMKALFIVAPLNFFLALVPILICLTLVPTGWAVSIAVAIASLAGLVVATGVAIPGLAASGWFTVSAIFLWLAGIGLGLWGMVLMAKITEWTVRGLWHWIRWNTRIIMSNT